MRDYFDDCKDVDANLELNLLTDKLHLILIYVVRAYKKTIVFSVFGKHGVLVKPKDDNSEEEYDKLKNIFESKKLEGIELGFARKSDFLSVIML
jgi:hypothetical protein